MSLIRVGIAAVVAAVMMLGAAPLAPVQAAGSSAAVIDAKVNAALVRLKEQVPGASTVLARAHGVLVFAEVIKLGFVVAGEGGEGALRINGRTAGYYNLFSGSVGFQAGAQKRDIILVFLDASTLRQFRQSRGWKVGIDGNVTFIDVGASGSIDSATLKKPIVAFMVGQKGLMAGISLDGSKITRLSR